MVALLSRRHLLAGSGATLIFTSAWPAKAQYVEAAIAVAKAAYSIYQSIEASKDQKELSDTVTAINLKLDVIIRNQDQILSDLRDLKIEVADLPQSIDLKSLVSVKDRFNAWVHARYPGPKSEVIDLFDDIQQITSNLSQDHYVAFSAFMAGMSMLAVTARHAGLSSQFKQLKNQYKPRVARWIDPSNQDSLSTLINLSKAAIDQRVNFLEKPHIFGRISVDYYQSNGDHCNSYKDLHVQITMNSPAQASVVQGEVFCHFDPNDPEVRNR